MARWWVNFIHIFFALTSYCALAAALWRRHQMLAAIGLLWFVLWGFTELLGVTINIWAVNLSWRAGFAVADASSREILRANLQGFSAIWDAMFFLLLVAFLLGTVFFGLAAARGKGLERLVGVLLLLAAPLTLGILIGGYTSITWVKPVTDWVYPVLQPISRALMGLWLWQQSSAHLATPDLLPNPSLERTRERQKCQGQTAAAAALTARRSKRRKDRACRPESRRIRRCLALLSKSAKG